MSRYPPVWCAVAFLATFAIQSLAAQKGRELEARSTDPSQPPPVFRARELLEPRVLRGPNYEMDEKVPLVDGRYLFTMHTTYGDFSILGRNLLEQRVHEMHVVERLRQIGMEPQIVAAALETLKNTPRGLGELLRDPAGAVLRTPRGLRRMIRSTLDPEQRAASQTRRQLAVQLDCDPETTNPILSSQLDSVAGRRSLGKLVSKLGMSAVVPGLGLVPLTAEIKDVVASSTPAQISAQVQKRLEALGIDESPARRFVAHPHYTSMQRLAFTGALEKLRETENLDVLVRAAVAAENETEALDTIYTARLLAELHGTVPVTSVHDKGLLVAILKGETHLLLVSDDYLTERAEPVEAVRAYRSEFPAAKALLFSPGRVSPQAAKSLQTADVAILEDGTVARLIAALERRETPRVGQGEPE